MNKLNTVLGYISVSTLILAILVAVYIAIYDTNAEHIWLLKTYFILGFVALLTMAGWFITNTEDF